MQTIKGCEKFTELMDFRGEAFQGWLALWRLKATLICPGLWPFGFPCFGIKREVCFVFKMLKFNQKKKKKDHFTFPADAFLVFLMENLLARWA